MRKTSILLALVIFISVNIFFGGCSNDKNNSTQENREITSNISNVVGYSEDSFNIENDYQTFFGDDNSIVACNEGYYYFMGEFIYFLDKKTDLAVPLCNKPDCTHTSKDIDCNAYFNVDQYYNHLGLYYYDSNIYIIGNDGKENSNKLYLYKISKDGSVREQSSYLGEFGSNINDMQIRFIIHKGIGYLAYSGDNKYELYSFNINEDKPQMKKIDKINGIGAEIYRLYGCDDGISYQYGCFTDESLETFEGGIKVCLNDKPQVVVNDAIKPYVIANGNVYYETNNGIKIRSLKSNKTENFNTESNSYSLNYDGRYFYAYNVMVDGSQAIYVYDNKQNYLGKFNTPDDTFSLLFGDTERFFCMCVDDKNASVLKYLDKSQIKDNINITEWKTVQ